MLFYNQLPKNSNYRQVAGLVFLMTNNSVLLMFRQNKTN
jgi:hypothetical protein